MKERFYKMKERLENLPRWMINLLTVISGVITVITPVATITYSFFSDDALNALQIVAILVLILFSAILFLRMRKYRNLANERMDVVSNNYHKAMHEARDLYFDIMHSHKKGTLSLRELKYTYPEKLTVMLDCLCSIMRSFTGQEVYACIKVFTALNDNKAIDLNNAKLVTFCRSSNSDKVRERYYRDRDIKLIDNTDFYEIMSPDYDNEYFYHGNLEKYDKDLHEVGLHYRNTNSCWRDYYIGTIVVPIRIEFRRLYHTKKDTEYHIIGFLCVDSMSENAFTTQQEAYNVAIMHSFADVFYMLLGQYRHYLRGMIKKNNADEKE